MKQKEGLVYHISNDERAKKSAKKIGDGLLHCLKTKKFTAITVTDVQKAANVGRATFYRLFGNIADVLSYLCDSVFEEVGRKYEKNNNFNPQETSLKFIREWMQNKALLEAIVDCNRMDILYETHLKYLGVNKDFFFPNVSLNEEATTYLMMTMTACTSACLAAWLKNGAYETAEQLQSRMGSCFYMLCAAFNR